MCHSCCSGKLAVVLFQWVCQWPVGLMDKASASGAGDSRFESWAGQVGACSPEWRAWPRMRQCEHGVCVTCRLRAHSTRIAGIRRTHIFATFTDLQAYCKVMCPVLMEVWVVASFISFYHRMPQIHVSLCHMHPHMHTHFHDSVPRT